MASIKLGPAVSDIRGSIGGTVFSRNGGGAYAKARIKGTNPNTARQQTVRSIMSGIYAVWAALSAAVQTGWKTYATNVTVINRLGDAINLSGYNMYTRSKALFDLIGATMPATAPTDFSLPGTDPTIAVSADESAQELSVTFDNSLPWAIAAGGYLLAYQGIPQNGTVNSYSGPYTYLGKVDGAATPPTSPHVFTPIYPVAAGQKCFMQFRIVEADGRVSTPFRCATTVVA